MVKHILLILDDEEYFLLKKMKGKKSWREFILESLLRNTPDRVEEVRQRIRFLKMQLEEIESFIDKESSNKTLFEYTS